jgi:hypothetical protein
VRTAWAPQIEAASSLRLNVEDDPALVPLETLPGRDHYRFPPLERPLGSGPSPGSDPGDLLETAALHGEQDSSRLL